MSTTRPWLEPDEVEPALLLPAPDRLDQQVLDLLGEVLGRSRIAGVVVAPRRAAEGARAALMVTCRARCHAAGAALLVEGDAAAVIEHAADGLLLADPVGLERARRLLGLERTIAVACALSRHAAMTAGEAGADLVLFADRAAPLPHRVDMVAWWSELFVLPCAVACADPAEGAELVRAGADFVIPPATIWTGPAAALEPYGRALAARADG